MYISWLKYHTNRSSFVNITKCCTFPFIRHLHIMAEPKPLVFRVVVLPRWCQTDSPSPVIQTFSDHYHGLWSSLSYCWSWKITSIDLHKYSIGHVGDHDFIYFVEQSNTPGQAKSSTEGTIQPLTFPYLHTFLKNSLTLMAVWHHVGVD